jgi:protein-tyrosine phosphatase
MSSLLKEIENFSTASKLKSVDTVVTTNDGKKFTECRTSSGDVTMTPHMETGLGFCPDYNEDWNVGIVMDNVLVASQDVAYDKQSLIKHGVTHILNVAAALPNAYQSDYQYLNVEMYDEEDEELMKHYPICEKFIDDSLTQGGKVLIHCRAGKSRSVSIAVAYLMHKKHLPWRKALDFIRTTRSYADPNKGFIRQLAMLEKDLNIQV